MGSGCRIGDMGRPKPRREPSVDAGTGTDRGAARSAPSNPRRKRQRRSVVRRAVYWSLVLGLWAVIAAGATIVVVAATLPAVQLLEIPKRPPSIQIVGNDGSLIASRGEMH